MQRFVIERGNPLSTDLLVKRQTNGFHEFILFVAVRLFTADGGLLQPTGGVKTTPQKTLFALWISSRNPRTGQNWVIGHSDNQNWLHEVQSETQQCVKWPEIPGKSVSVVDANARDFMHWRSFVFCSLSSLLAISVIVFWLPCVDACTLWLEAQVWVSVHTIVILMFHACVVRLFRLLRLILSLHLPSLHLSHHLALPAALFGNNGQQFSCDPLCGLCGSLPQGHSLPWHHRQIDLPHEAMWIRSYCVKENMDGC